jgi:hypothetical protein
MRGWVRRDVSAFSAAPIVIATSPLPRSKRILFGALAIVGGILLGFVMLEGALSAALFVRDVVYYIEAHAPGGPTTREYDPELGWVNKSNAYDANAYGHGIYVRTNGQRARANHDFAPFLQSNRIRVVCSGDSFTYGVGVDNDHTWCQLLEQKNPHLETVNLGQSAYGVDQIYLRYRRDAPHIHHDVHLFAIITDDFRRMRSTADGPYGKPILVLQNGALALRNVPVPRRPEPLWQRGLLATAPDLRAFEFIRRVRGGFVHRSPVDQAVLDSATWEVAAKIADSLGAMARSTDAALVWVLLPTSVDYLGASAEPWQRRLRAAAGKQFLYLDLISEFKQLPPDSIDAMFFRPNRENDAGGHYTERGNAWVAARIYRFLDTLPVVSRRLSAPEGTVPPVGSAPVSSEDWVSSVSDSDSEGRIRGFYAR